MGFDDEVKDSYATLFLTDDDGKEEEFAIIDSVESDGVSYILVVEVAYLDDENSEAMILKKTEENGEEVAYSIIEDDDEFDKVADLFAAENDDYGIEVE